MAVRAVVDDGGGGGGAEAGAGAGAGPPGALTSSASGKKMFEMKPWRAAGSSPTGYPSHPGGIRYAVDVAGATLLVGAHVVSSCIHTHTHTQCVRLLYTYCLFF